MKTAFTGNASAQIIHAFLKDANEISIYSKNAIQTLQAQVVELDIKSGNLILETEYDGQHIEHYVDNGRLSFDIEALNLSEDGEREAYSVNNIAATTFKADQSTYRLECKLPDSVFVQENRSSIRIPFILGMQTRVNLEVYPRELNITGRVRNLSAGGCMIEIRIADSIALSVGQTLPGVTLNFPNGQTFFAEGRVRHMRPFGNRGHAALGLEFVNLTNLQSEDSNHYALEAERDAAYRAGASRKIVAPSQLFVQGVKEKTIQQNEERVRRKRSRQSPMQRGVLQVAHQLQVGLMYMKTRDFFPEELFYDCTDAILYLDEEDRKAFLYALGFLRSEPEWIRHAIQVAARLADLLRIRDPHSTEIREAVLGALLHVLGKPLLVSEALPSLKGSMDPRQKVLLQTHTVRLLDTLEMLGWSPSATCRDVLENANEKLDGSGYPAGKTASQLTELSKLVALIKIIDKQTNERNGLPPRPPFEAYRWVNERPSLFDKTLLVEYIQTYGLYPIGSLVKFTGGFLAWIIDIDSRGMPNKVHVVKNLAFSETNISIVLTTGDFSQIGKLESAINPTDYGV